MVLKSSFNHTLNTILKVYEIKFISKELLGFKFNPPIDEFNNKTSRSKINIKPKTNYYLA